MNTSLACFMESSSLVSVGERFVDFRIFSFVEDGFSLTRIVAYVMYLNS